MNTFTYKTYIDVIHTLRLNTILQLAEESNNYQLSIPHSHNKQKRIIKNILKNNEEMANFLNQFLNLNTFIKPNELLLYKNENIRKKYINKETPLVYYLKKNNILFLVEHQSTINRNISYKMLNYCINIMQEYIQDNKSGKNVSYPIIIPILIYTGNKKWKTHNVSKEKQVSDYVFENYKINFKYNILDISKFSTQALFNRKSLFSYSILLDKSQSKQELISTFDKIINQIDRDDYSEKLSNILSYLLSNSQ